MFFAGFDMSRFSIEKSHPRPWIYVGSEIIVGLNLARPARREDAKQDMCACVISRLATPVGVCCRTQAVDSNFTRWQVGNDLTASPPTSRAKSAAARRALALAVELYRPARHGEHDRAFQHPGELGGA